MQQCVFVCAVRTWLKPRMDLEPVMAKVVRWYTFDQAVEKFGYRALRVCPASRREWFPVPPVNHYVYKVKCRRPSRPFICCDMFNS